MPITQEELGSRLKQARNVIGLSQQEVADDLDIPRTAVAQIEGGNRSVNSIELDKLSRLYKRGMSDFFAESFEEDPTHVLLRALEHVDINGKKIDRQYLLDCAKLCQEITDLEKLLGLPMPSIVPISYVLAPPEGRWGAVQQGMYLAEQERKRLNLGTQPVVDLPELIRRQGVRIARHKFPDNISGAFFHGRTTGLVMVVNMEHVRTRHLFTYAHEYCHVLADRNRSGLISHNNNRDELFEVRANAFASHFLMPEGGVRNFFYNLGKSEPLRQVTEIFDGTEQVTAQRREPAKEISIEVHHIVSLAYHFGLSYEATLYQLLNLKLITKDQLLLLKQGAHREKPIQKVLKFMPYDRYAKTDTLQEQIMELALEAYGRELISKKKLFEFARDANITQSEIERAIDTDGDSDAVDAVFPA